MGRNAKPVSQDLARARLRKERALAKYREMQNRRLAGALLDADAVEKRWAAGLATLRDRLLALPDRLGAILAGRPEVEVRAMLREAIEEALRTAHEEV